MVASILIFVSKRLQRPAAAILCLMVVQLAGAAASRQSEPAATAVRVAIGR